MVMMNTLNPTHNQVEPLNPSMKKSKIALGWRRCKRLSELRSVLISPLRISAILCASAVERGRKL
jgi:hypothetical protein